MQQIDIAKTDLNLLVVLDVLLEERNVTRAARRLHRTQSATSHALSRLREQLGDPILVRVAGEMRPTPKAEQLAGEVSRLLRSIGRVLSMESAFDPHVTDRVFSLAGPDFVAAILPSLLERTASVPSRAGIEIVAPGPRMLRDVAEGRLDIAIAPTAAPKTDGLRSTPLASLDWAVFARAQHPALSHWNATTWAAYPHVRVRTASGTESPVDIAARKQKLTRRAGAYLPHFLLAPPLLSRTDLLLTVPRAVLAEVAPRFGLVTCECPLKLAPIELSVYWSAQLDRDPAISWFRGLLTEAAKEVFRSAKHKRTLTSTRRQPYRLSSL